jgi:hypothetical protein
MIHDYLKQIGTFCKGWTVDVDRKPSLDARGSSTNEHFPCPPSYKRQHRRVFGCPENADNVYSTTDLGSTSVTRSSADSSKHPAKSLSQSLPSTLSDSFLHHGFCIAAAKCDASSTRLFLREYSWKPAMTNPQSQVVPTPNLNE